MMTSNGPATVSKAFAKAERFMQTLCRAWAYAMSFQNAEERNRWLPRYLAIDNRLRKHAAIGWHSPQQRLAELLR